MENSGIDFFKIENHFKETEHIPSIPVFENHRKEVPMFTIAIPTYKRADYLKEALESAINQATDIPYEIIVVDNNPERNDETELLMAKYAYNQHVSYYKNAENIGLVSNWNRLYLLSHTEWVIMLHDDDILLPDFIEFHYKILNYLPDSSVIYPSYYNSKSQKHIKSNTRYKKLSLNDFIFGNIIGPPLGMIFRQRDFITLGGFSQNSYPSIDEEIYLRAIYANLNCYKIISSSKAMYRIEVNVSMKPQTIIGFIGNGQKVSNLILQTKKGLSKILYKEALKTNSVIQLNKFINMTNIASPELKRHLLELKRYESKISKILYVFLNVWERAVYRFKCSNLKSAKQ